jgi:hypothetical protein
MKAMGRATSGRVRGGRTLGAIVGSLMIGGGALYAQTVERPAQPVDRTVPSATRAADLQDAMRLKESRYQIGQMERLLEGAVEHGATMIRDQLSAMMPADMLLAENARARGFRLDGYGVFFDVEVPSLTGTLPWSFMTLSRNNLGLDNALETLRSYVDASAADNVNLQQALKRIELQVAPAGAPGLFATRPTNAVAVGSQAQDNVAVMPPPNSIEDVNEAYRQQIREAMIDAMLDHSRSLNISVSERLTVAGRGADPRPRLAPADNESRTVTMTIRGSDLAALMAGQITRDEARARVEIRVF